MTQAICRSTGERRRQVDEVVVYCDGGSRGNPGPAAIGAVVLDPSTDPPTRLAEVSECIGVTTNNVAEYQALIAGLEAAAPLARARASACAPTRCSMIKQVEGEWKVKQRAPASRCYAEARALLARVRRRRPRSTSAREQNTDADALVNAALDAALRR